MNKIEDLPEIILWNGSYVSVNVVSVKARLEHRYESVSSKFHIKQLNGDDVDGWLNDCLESYKRIRVGLLKGIGIEMDNVELNKHKSGEQKKNFDKGEDAIEAVKDINEFNVFGCFLPARRCRDHSTLQIVDDKPEEIGKNNFYVKATNELIFND